MGATHGQFCKASEFRGEQRACTWLAKFFKKAEHRPDIFRSRWRGRGQITHRAAVGFIIMNRSDITTATKILHHTLGDSVFSSILRMHESITVAGAILTPENAMMGIDLVLKQMVLRRPPAYLVLPTDVVSVSVVHPAPFERPETHRDSDRLAAFCNKAGHWLSEATHIAVQPISSSITSIFVTSSRNSSTPGIFPAQPC
jgi:hypothetical protein